MLPVCTTEELSTGHGSPQRYYLNKNTTNWSMSQYDFVCHMLNVLTFPIYKREVVRATQSVSAK